MTRLLFVSLVSAVVLSACGQAEVSAEPVVSEASGYQVREVAQGLEHPWAMAFLPDGSYLVTERRGKLWRVGADGTKTDIRGVPEVFHAGQAGLLDVILEPNFTSNGWIYFSYSGADKSGNANTEIARAKLDLQRNALTDVRVIFRAMPKVSGNNHWGSRLLFAPDGTLYATLGDRWDHKDRAQDVTSHFGTVVRLMPDGRVPDDNPFKAQEDALDEIYSYGHRNIQGMALNPETQEVWINEHGPRGGDEINILKAGANYGWPKATFGINYWGTKISNDTSIAGMEDPAYQWTPSIAPSGMAFYTGDKFADWKGDVFVGALAGQHLQRLRNVNGEIILQERLLEERKERIRDVRTGPDGFIYVLTDEANGKILRLEP